MSSAIFSKILALSSTLIFFQSEALLLSRHLLSRVGSSKATEPNSIPLQIELTLFVDKLVSLLPSYIE